MGTDDLHHKKFERQKPSLKPKKVILILCEGKKTEINYFQRLKESLHLTNLHIQSAKRSAPTHIIQEAKDSSDYDEIYCVFDKDSHENLDKALQEAQKYKIQAIVSAPCFEFWLLLHFMATTQDFMTCKAVQKHKDFKKNLPYYQKDYDFKDLIKKHLHTAIKNAKHINKINLKEMKAPYTQIVTLVERLQKQAKERAL